MDPPVAAGGLAGAAGRRARLAPRGQTVLLAAVALYAVAALATGIRGGGDLEIHLPEANLWLERLPLYSAAPRVGAWCPPFAILVVVPFALVAHASAALAKAGWALLSLACLGWALARAPRRHWRDAALAVAAVAVPLHRNFEDLNLNAVLLAALVAAALALAAGREERAGLWIGVATALKVFPGLLLVYLAYRRRWRALVVAAAVVAGLTILAVLPYGVRGGFDTLRAWLAQSTPATSSFQGSNQSVAALVHRLHGGSVAVALTDLGCVALALAALRRARPSGESADAFGDVGTVTLLAVLLSPVAWVHYFGLAFPAWLTALDRGSWRRVLLAAGVATSGVLTVWSLSLRGAVFDLSLYTWGALLLLAALAFPPAPGPPGPTSPRP
jgi:alpha-1,2-mannosyltransferase